MIHSSLPVPHNPFPGEWLDILRQSAGPNLSLIPAPPPHHLFTFPSGSFGRVAPVVGVAAGDVMGGTVGDERYTRGPPTRHTRVITGSLDQPGTHRAAVQHRHMHNTWTTHAAADPATSHAISAVTGCCHFQNYTYQL